jgi:transcriptional regulator with PAS, ATPase and Fis domain
LTDLVKTGKFREDLYYRVNVVRVDLPPLRQRKEDIPLLIDHFVARFNRLRGREIAGVSPETLAILLSHEYPGNIRELENVIEHAFILCRGGVIQPDHLPEPLLPKQPSVAHVKTFRDLEARFIFDVLRRNEWNRLRAAKELGVHKTTLWRKIRHLKLKIPKVAKSQLHCL